MVLIKEIVCLRLETIVKSRNMLPLAYYIEWWALIYFTDFLI
jgi:hypothetical protein